MNWSLVRRSVRDLRWHIFWYGTGLALYAAFIVLLYPTFKDVLGETQYPEEILQFFGGSGDLTAPDQFITLEYNSFVPLILLIYAVVVGTGLLAGDEGRGTLENLLAQPISRLRVFGSRAAALLAGAVLICTVNVVGWLVTFPLIDLSPLGLGDLFLATFSVLPVVAFFGALAMLAGAVAPSRGMAAGLLTAVVVATYLLASFAEVITVLEWTRNVNPYYYSDASRVLADGVVWWHQVVLVVGALALFTAAAVAFAGREIAAGTWQPAALARGLGALRGEGARAARAAR